MTQGERIMGVEVEVRELKKAFDEHKVITANEFQIVRGEFKNLDTKLDEILALRNKGAGVFWLVSCLVGTGIIGMIVQFVSWVKG